ncbi:hypothetical protein CPAV1605_1073 [seawater metagenome]|uniref:Uncharacterized protein n=1 Tax=seawater metagenome TaxID=1561972 RepID=A0A5E8CM33_9ZZZZ
MIKNIKIPEDFEKLQSIQGGKMTHIFKINNNFYENQYADPEAESALKNGMWTLKIHGSNGFLTKENGIIKIWQRRDIKDKNLSEMTFESEILKLEDINKSLLFNKTVLPEIYESNHKKHHYIYVHILPSSKMGKILYPRMEVLLLDYDEIYQSIEIVGKKVQGNPDQFNWNTLNNTNYGIVFHGSVIFNPLTSS